MRPDIRVTALPFAGFRLLFMYSLWAFLHISQFSLRLRCLLYAAELPHGNGGLGRLPEPLPPITVARVFWRWLGDVVVATRGIPHRQ